MTGLTLAQAAGFAGTVVILAMFARQTIGGRAPDLAFNLGNFVGASLLAYSLTVDFNLPALLLELAWAFIALVGVARTLGQR